MLWILLLLSEFQSTSKLLADKWSQTEHKEYLSIYLQIPWLYKQWAPITKGCSGIFQTNHSKSLSAWCLRPCAVSIRSEACGDGDWLGSDQDTGKLYFNVLINHAHRMPQRKKNTELNAIMLLVSSKYESMKNKCVGVKLKWMFIIFINILCHLSQLILIWSIEMSCSCPSFSFAKCIECTSQHIYSEAFWHKPNLRSHQAE